MKSGHIVFVINLLQDINIIRPLAYMASRDLGHRTLFLVTGAFRKRDKSGIWQQELAEIIRDTHAEVINFDHEFDALKALQDKSGLMIAASESHLNAHKPVHDLFLFAPSQFQKITLQHGFECVGFLQSRDQDMAHGTNITFAADTICGWCDAERLTAIAPSQRHKLYVTGPTAVLQMPLEGSNKDPLGIGLVCENMHSPRLNVAGDFKTSFLSIFGDYCFALQAEGRKVALRPHPGGQYTLKNNVPLPENVVINNVPIYKTDLSRYAYGISAPSSILIDMVLAGIPTAVWQDQDSIMDLGNYEGLTRISSLNDWLEFSKEAVSRPNQFIEQQDRFLKAQKLHYNEKEVYQSYSKLLRQADITHAEYPIRFIPEERIQFIANGFTPTLQLSFLKPLSSLVASGHISVDVISELHLNKLYKRSDTRAHDWLINRFTSFRPTLVVFSRYSGPHSEFMLKYLNDNNIPTIYHLDDDLLNIPPEIGATKHQFHNRPERLASVRYLLDNVSLIYCSTHKLKLRLEDLHVKAPIIAGGIYCSAKILNTPNDNTVQKIGYMGIGHESDLESILPALVTYLRSNENVIFEIFGTIPIPNIFLEFGDRVRQVPKLDNYEEFLQRFATLKWDIGICPLTPINFNMLKANTKWVEYTSVGTAVVASRNTIYDDCCADGCGILANTEEEWLAALDNLTRDTEKRLLMVKRAQEKVINEYSVKNLREQVINVFNMAKSIKYNNTLARVSLKCVPTTTKTSRILYVSNSLVPTLQLSFIKPLAPLIRSNDIIADYLTEEQIKQEIWKTQGYTSVRAWIIERFAKFNPTIVVFCRYSGPHAELMIELTQRIAISSIYHIDDDLLNIPIAIGEEKYKFHNRPQRIQAVNFLLENVYLVYCSTQKLKTTLKNIPINTPIVSGEIYCSGSIINKPNNRPIRKIGYMASADHAHNLDIVIGPIIRILREHPTVIFEFFGSIPLPAKLKAFKNRIKHAPKIDNYEEFLQRFAEYEWDIGICPLSPIHFNMMKANTKWVEYTSVGTAVVASKGTVYDECCSDGCGILADTEDEWFAALDRLARDPEARFNQVLLAQEKLASTYSTERLREQVLDIFSQAHNLFIKSKLKEPQA